MNPKCTVTKSSNHLPAEYGINGKMGTPQCRKNWNVAKEHHESKQPQ